MNNCDYNVIMRIEKGNECVNDYEGFILTLKVIEIDELKSLDTKRYQWGKMDKVVWRIEI